MGLDRAVLVRLAGIVAARQHAVVGAERLVAAGDIGRGVGVEVPVGGRQAVGAMFRRHAAKGPERGREVLGERREALAAEHDGGVFPAAVGQDEVVEALLQRLARDRHAEFGRIREVRQRHPAVLRRLAEDHVALGSVQGTPVADAPLERAAHTVAREGLGVGHLKVPQQSDGLNGRIALKDRQQHPIPHRLERVGDGATSGHRTVRGKPWIGVDAPGGAFAEARAGGGGALAVLETVGHVDSHLLVGDGFARHGRISVWSQRPRPYRPAAASTHQSPPKRGPAAGFSLRDGLRPPSG